MELLAIDKPTSDSGADDVAFDRIDAGAGGLDRDGPGVGACFSAVYGKSRFDLAVASDGVDIDVEMRAGGSHDRRNVFRNGSNTLFIKCFLCSECWYLLETLSLIQRLISFDLLLLVHR